MLKVIEAFAGVGSQRMALRNLGIEHEVVGIFEIDKFALKSYEAIHGECPNLGDISKIDVKDIPDHDLFTYSFPCQDLSVAGKQKGMVRGVTRSGLLYECEKIIKHCKPKYLLLENVKNLVGKKNKPQFDEWLKFLEDLGYTNYWKVLNAKDYGVPQNRERVFVVSVLGEHEPYSFPPPIKLDKSIKDILENKVEEKYYMNKPFHLVNKRNEAAELQIKAHRNIKSVQSPNHICPTLTTMQGGHREPKILENYTVCEQRCDEGLRFFKDNICGTVRTIDSGGDKRIIETIPQFRVRKLTPLECWRLMSFTDEDFYKAKNVGISNSQLYKQAGNSIVVKVLEGIFKELFLSEKENNERDFEIVKLGNTEVEQLKWVI